MKKNLFKLAVLIPALAGSLMAFAPAGVNEDEPKSGVYIENPNYDFGTIKEDGGPKTAVFKIFNGSDEFINIVSVPKVCGCTEPNWTKEPIAPGKTGEITATYNPKGRPGGFSKVLTATINTGEKFKLYFKGTVEAGE
jgi:hypothetical protein